MFVTVFLWLLVYLLPIGGACPEAINITVIYNALIWPRNDWKLVISRQLMHLKETGLHECSVIHAFLSAPTHDSHKSKKKKSFDYEELETLLKEGSELVYSILPKWRPGKFGSVVTQIHENSFEFPGIHYMWAMATALDEPTASRTVFLYFHTKGMVNHGHLKERLHVEHWLFNWTIVPWRRAVEEFTTNISTTRIGILPSTRGFIFNNFFWVRASFVQERPEPARTNRYYYEVWLGMEESDSGEEKYVGCYTCYTLGPHGSMYGLLYSQLLQCTLDTESTAPRE
eukprot:GGOE01006171.1.p1 GENE.GGOE01006171.1~~GGOE01006171.1.p1  ORF type:complete len:285 (-),score=26.39 GGOE01006171.1:559-1413(-)